MFHSRVLSKRAFSLKDRKNLSFPELLKNDKSFTIHERNLQKLEIEMYKVKNNLCPEPFQDLFSPKQRGNGDFVIPKVSTEN